MTRETIVFLAGIVLVVLPHLGVPNHWKTYGISLLGALLIFIGYSLRRSAFYRSIDNGSGERGTDMFIENTAPLFTDD